MKRYFLAFFFWIFLSFHAWNTLAIPMQCNPFDPYYLGSIHNKAVLKNPTTEEWEDPEREMAYRLLEVVVDETSKTAYAVDDTSGYIRIFDVSDVTKPHEIGIWKNIARPYLPQPKSQDVDISYGGKEAKALSVVLSKTDKLLIVGTYDRIQILDISQRRFPRRLGWVASPAYGVAISQDGNTVVTSGGVFGMNVIDITDKENPRVVGTFPKLGFSSNSVISKDGNTVFMCDTYHGLTVLDITDRSKPKEISVYILNGIVHIALSKDETTAFIVAQKIGFKILDIRNLKNIHFIGGLENSGVLSRLAVNSKESVVYVGDYEKLQIIDISDRYSPRLAGIRTDWGKAKGLTLSKDDSTLFVADQTVLTILCVDMFNATSMIPEQYSYTPEEVFL